MNPQNLNQFQMQQWALTSATNNTSYGYPQVPIHASYQPPPTWHNFACGHQMKLEPGQPAPGRCPTCPPPEYENYTYTKCGHVYSYQKGQAVPHECPACSSRRYQEEQAAKKRAEEDAVAEAKRREDDKDLRVWLDREVTRVREPIA